MINLQYIYHNGTRQYIMGVEDLFEVIEDEIVALRKWITVDRLVNGWTYCGDFRVKYFEWNGPE